MKTYPTITGLTPKMREAIHGCPVYLFRKDDGSNMRVEWSSKTGFCKWGRRNGLLDDSNPFLLEAPELFMAKYSEGIDRRLRKTGKITKSTIYFELFGPNSMFGHHVAEKHDIQIFDIAHDRQGFLDPVNFIRFMEQAGYDPGHIVAFKFKADDNSVLDTVRDGSLPGISFEGVVGREEGGRHIFKYKCQRWYDALKEHCGDNQDLYNILK